MGAAEGILAFHEGTKHSFDSVRSGRHWLDWENEPSKFKEYLDIRPESLPRFEPSGVSAHRAIQASARENGNRALDTEVLSHLLHHGAGVARTLRTAAGRHHFRVYASAGALYPVEAYLVTGRDVEGLRPGAYHYAPREHGLRLIRPGDLRGNLGMVGPPEAAAMVVLAGIPWRTAWKYTARGFRHLYWDAGMMLANLLAAAAAHRIRARLVLGFVDEDVDHVIGVDGRTEFALCLVALGEGSDAAASEVPPLDARVEAISRRPRVDREIEKAREAIRLKDADQVRSFRASRVRAGPPLDGTIIDVASPPGEALSADSLEAVIARRGSSRRMAPEPFPAPEYLALASAAVGPVPGDRPSVPLSVFVAAAALDGVPPGAFQVLPGRGFQTIARGSPRSRVGHLCLDQRLGADAAAVTFLTADLRKVTATLGPRGYAVAQLEAGVAAGRLYLGAYAQCLGASGITFYDDEVREFFQTEEEPMLAVVMGPEGRRRDLRQCRQERSGAA